MQTNYVTLIISLLGALKLAFQAFGLSFITDDQINAVSNVLAVVVTLGVGIYMNHRKEKENGSSNASTEK